MIEMSKANGVASNSILDIPVQMRILMDSLDHLEKHISDLGSRLDPILGALHTDNARPGEEGGKPVPEHICELGNQIRHAVELCDKSDDQITRLLEALQI